MKIYAIAVLMMLTGCATNTYIPPQDGSAATLEVRRTADSDPSLYIYMNSKECSIERSVGKSEVGVITSLAANREQTIALADITTYKDGSRYLCRLYSTFFPVEGGHYVATLNYTGFGCYMDIKKKTASGEVKEDFMPRKGLETVWTNASSFCE
jgi:hypothetical protein